MARRHDLDLEAEPLSEDLDLPPAVPSRQGQYKPDPWKQRREARIGAATLCAQIDSRRNRRKGVRLCASPQDAQFHAHHFADDHSLRPRLSSLRSRRTPHKHASNQRPELKRAPCRSSRWRSHDRPALSATQDGIICRQMHQRNMVPHGKERMASSALLSRSSPSLRLRSLGRSSTVAGLATLLAANTSG